MSCELEGFMNGQQFKKLSEKKCEALMSKCNLRKIEIDILFFLSSYNRYNTAKDIVSLKCLSKAHVSKAIENLCHQELIETTMANDDRRCVYLTVTGKAKPILDEINLIQDEIYAIVYAGVSEDEKNLLLKLTKKITDNINAALSNK